jgi:hypothetical protein
LVGIYHRRLCGAGNPYCNDGEMIWAPRPCSGVIVGGRLLRTWILTARHCITHNGLQDGTPVATTDLAVITSRNPGIIPYDSIQSTSTARPLGTEAVSTIRVLEVQSGLSSPAGYDLALLRVNKTLDRGGGRVSLAFAATQGPGLSPNSLVAYGYGRFVMGDVSGFEEDDGAGVLRWGRGFDILSPVCLPGDTGCGNGYYSYGNMTAEGNRIAHGDSGGPTFFQGTTFMRALGIHSAYYPLNGDGVGGMRDASIAGNFVWITEALGGISMFPHNSPTTPIGAKGDSSSFLATPETIESTETGVTTWHFSDSNVSRTNRFMYILNSAGTRYYLTRGTNNTVRVAPFLGSVDTQWNASGDHLRDAFDTTRCLALSASKQLVMAPCVSGDTSLVWTFSDY